MKLEFIYVKKAAGPDCAAGPKVLRTQTRVSNCSHFTNSAIEPPLRRYGHAAGDAVIIIDADLQDPPEVIPQMIERWRQGYEVVYGHRIARQGETAVKKSMARFYYRLLRRITEVDIPVDVGDFRLIDARVCSALSAMPAHNRYVRGLISWLGYRQTFVDYERAPRYAGKTKYPLRKMVKLAVDGITSFSYKPLKMGIGIGIALSICSFCFLLFVFIAPALFDLGRHGAGGMLPDVCYPVFSAASF